LTLGAAAATLTAVNRGQSIVTAKRFAQGMTFEQYAAYTGTPENLAREAGWWLGRQRQDCSGVLRTWYEQARVSEAQTAAIRWLVAQPEGPTKILVISEEWSSDCRRDVPMLARLAEAGGLELRIFQRDGQKFSQSPRSDPAESPNADIVNELLNAKNGQTFQSVPAAAFLTRDFEALYRYFEFPAIYHKMRVAEAMQVAKPGESREQAWDRFIRDWRALQEESPFFRMWASAAVDEMLSALHERVVVGPGPAS
jgi:thiol-disulfide isomerase/thioredoxin